MGLRVNKVVSGLMLGMMLQIAVGPVCIYLINVSILNNFFAGFVGAISATLADAVFILLGVIGVSKLLNERRIKIFKIFGGSVLLLFGTITILSFSSSGLGAHSVVSSLFAGNNVFLYTFILTLSSPLSVIFWSGIFSVKIIEEKYEKIDLVFFSIGCLLATFIFLTVVVAASAFMQRFLTEALIRYLNIAVGVIIVCFGVKLFFCKTDKKGNGNET